MNNQIKPVAHIVLKFARRLTDSAIEADDIAQCAMLCDLANYLAKIGE